MPELSERIGVYTNNAEQKTIDAQFVSARLQPEAKAELYKGSEQYRASYEQKVSDYQNKIGSITETGVAPNANDRQYFRRQFVQMIERKVAEQGNECAVSDAIKATNPEEATIKLNEFLGEDGAQLYKLALEEEMHSEEYMNAVFRQSITHYEGEQWRDRPVIFVGGPSGCGKTTVAQGVVEKSKLFLAKTTEGGTNSPGNDVLAVDGGTAREVSQMRNLIIDAAVKKGYSGIADIHNNSSILGGVKSRIFEVGVASPSLGIVIPETFSDFISPNSESRRLINRVMDLPNTKPIFARVDGEKPSLFQRVVAFMGSRRAWKTSGFDKAKEQPLDLNNSNQTNPESKAYGASGFNFGQIGSKLAEKYFLHLCKAKGREHLAVSAVNDLTLKRESEPGVWVDAQQGEPGATLVAQRAVDQWETMRQIAPNQVRLPPILHTSANIDTAIANEYVNKRIAFISQQMANAPASNQYANWQSKNESLAMISELLESCSNSTNPAEIQKAKESIKEIKNTMEQRGDFMLFFSKTKQQIDNSIKALDKLANEATVGVTMEEKTTPSPSQEQPEMSEGPSLRM